MSDPAETETETAVVESETEGSQPEPAEPEEAEADEERRPWWTGGPLEHPIGTTVALGLLFVVFQTWWVMRSRHLGAFDVDEEGGLAAALRFHRSILSGPQPLLQVVFDTRNGPLVPLLSVPLLLLGPRTVHTAMVAQSLLMVAAACGVAGITRAITGPRIATLAGAMTIGLSVSVVSSRSYQYSSGVGAFLALSMWALLASDRGRSRRCMVLFGVFAGCMLLSRTMSAGFVPALAAAAAVTCARERKVLVNVALSALAALVVAGPWWFVQWDAIVDYLVVNAYGDRAHYWGSTGFFERIRDHLYFQAADFRLTAVALLVATGIGVASVVSSLARRGRVLDGPPGTRRPLAAVWVCIVLVTAALLSTSNRGFWFAYPVDVLIVAGALGLVVRSTPPGSAPARRRVAIVSVLGVVALVATLVASVGPTGPGLRPSSEWSLADRLVSNLDPLQRGNIEADFRLGSQQASVREDAAAEWYAAASALADEVARIEGDVGTLWQSVTGEIHLFNANTIGLVEEQERRGINGIHVVNTLEPPESELRRDLTPFRLGVPRILVIVDGRSLPFPDGRGADRFRRLALDEGWDEARRIPLPDGGDVTVYTHPRSVPAG